jgi:regulator of protease activity HflC (stomatin/prohibitin superfamily)
MKNLDASIANQGILDESVSNFTAKDLFTPKAVTAALATGNPLGAIYEAKRQDALKAKAEAAKANATAADIQAAAQAQIELAQAEADLAKSQLQSQGSNSQMKMGDEKKFPWLLVGGITFGVLALGVTAYFVFRKK